MAQPILSIVIPTYNRAEYINGTLASIESQTHFPDDIEIIISNDGSTDKTFEIIESFKNKHPKKNINLYHHKKNLGGPGNWKFCLEHATGEFIFLLSDDDWIAPTFLDEYLKIIKTYPDIDIVYSGMEYRDNGMTPLSVSFLSSIEGLQNGHERLQNFLLASHMVMTSMYRRETLLAAGGWDEKFGVHLDGAAFARTALISKKTYFIKSPLFYYRIMTQSWSSFNINKQIANFRCFRLIFDSLIQDSKTVSPDLLPFLQKQYHRHAIRVLSWLEIKYAHGNVNRRDLRRLIKDLMSVYPSIFFSRSLLKMFLISAIGNAWLKILRELTHKPDPYQSESSVFEKAARS